MTKNSGSILLISLAAIGCEGPAPEGSASTSTPIIGDVPAPAGAYPATGALVGIMRQNGRITQAALDCTATLIAPDAALTAAHCVDPMTVPSSVQLYFTLSPDVSSMPTTYQLPSDAVQVRSYVEHPLADVAGLGDRGLGDHHDLALVFLEHALTAPVAALAEADDGAFLVAQASVVIVGYGLTSPADRTSSGVKEHATTVINEIGPAEMQIGAQTPAPQKCHGDSGGPTYLTLDDGHAPSVRLVGITSRAYDPRQDCRLGGVDTRVDVARAWIDGALVDACARGARGACPAGPDAGVRADGGATATSDAGASGGAHRHGPCSAAPASRACASCDHAAISSCLAAGGACAGAYAAFARCFAAAGCVSPGGTNPYCAEYFCPSEHARVTACLVNTCPERLPCW